MRPVVVGVDGSEQSLRALDWAVGYALLLGTSVQALMTVLPTDDAAETRATVLAGESTLGSIVGRVVDARDPAPPVSFDVEVADPAVALVNASRSAEVVVLGSHGMSKISDPSLGSVSLACIRLGSCPVVVIPPGKPEPPDEADLEAV